MRTWKGGRSLPAAVLTYLVILFPDATQAQQVPASRDRLTIAFPGATWALEIGTSGFTVQKDELSSDRMRRHIYAIGPDPDVVLSVRLERASGHQRAAECRRYAWDHLRTRSPFRMDDVTKSGVKELAILEYRVKEFQRLPVEQRHLHGYLAKDDVCVEIHVSKVRSTAADRPALAAILESARITPLAF